MLNVDDEKMYKQRKVIENTKDMKIIQNPEMKENWAISMENRMKDQELKTGQILTQMSDKQETMLDEFKLMIQDGAEKSDENLRIMSATMDAKLSSMKKQISNKFDDVDSRIDQASIIKSNGGVAKSGDIALNKDLLPIIRKNTKEVDSHPEDSLYDIDRKVSKSTPAAPLFENDEKGSLPVAKTPGSKATDKSIILADNTPKHKSIKMIEIDTSFNKGVISAQEKIEQEVEASKDEKINNSYHISTGLSQAYMITGAYAPAFQEGEAEPLPVLFEAEGDIIMPNSNTGTIQKCFILGSAKGNMNSQTASIKLVSISCLINGGTHRIEAPISGWVIGENGIPGIHGELLHKNGAWLARTFVSGFLETFSSALVAGAGSGKVNVGTGTTGTNTGASASFNGEQLSNNAYSAGAKGMSTVFGKLGEYYLKMAEQIFPVIEVKGGRTIDILLIGGEELTVVENNKLDIQRMRDNIEKAELKKSQKDAKISSQANAFTRTVNGNSDSKVISKLSGDKK
jgi:hypothetical protein